MSVSTTSVSVSYAGNASTSAAYPVTFPFFDATDLSVVVNASGVPTTLVLGTGYTVSGGAGTTGSITTTSAVPATSQVVITRNTAKTQLTSYTTGDRFPASTHEKALDKLTLMVQEATANNLPATATASGTAPYVLQASSPGATPAWVPLSSGGIAAGSITNAMLAGSITAGKLSTGGPTWDTSGNLTATSFVGNASTASSAEKLATPRTIGLSGDITGTASFDGSANATIAATISTGAVITADLADSAVTSAKIADTAVSTAKIANNAVTAAKLGTNEQKQIAKAWVNFNGASAGNPDYPTGNTVTYAAGSSTTLVTVTRSAHSIAVNDWITVSGVTGATAVNGTFQVSAVTGTTFQYIVNSVVTGTVGGTAVVRITTIRSSYNVSSITKNGTGDYTVNFTTAMADAYYSYVGSSRYNRDDTTGYAPCLYSFASDTKTINAVRVRSYTAYQTVQDSSECNLVVLGN
jgi:hypothetical protein